MAICGDLFLARLVDICHRKEDLEVEVSFDKVSEEDRDLISLGAIFDYVIYSEKDIWTLKFRHFPVWTEKEISEARRDALEILDER